MSATDFETLVEGLLEPGAYPHPVSEVERIETHISVVLLAGAFAYKLKKPLDLGFLDFSTLARRHSLCGEELRLNRRLAPEIYLSVEPVTGAPAHPRIGGEGEVIEYAVKMRRFPQEALLSRRTVTPDVVERIAVRVADFHAGIPTAAPDSDYGSQAAVLGPMLENFRHIRPGLAAGQQGRIDAIEAWTRAHAEALQGEIAERRREGHVRECHGDMHRGNIAIIDDEVVIFDAIEFSPALRWIDTISEVAFLVMDLDEGGYPVLGRRFLNRYLELTGDYAGLPLLDFYKVYRAMVRAKVIAIRLGQAHVEAEEAAADRRDLARYLSLAEGYTRAHRPTLVLMHGLSGSGKSWLANGLLDHLPAIRIRSDIERKRLFGLGADADSAATVGDIYTREATARTYERLRGQARTLLTAGYDVLVDAAFLRQEQRRAFLALADELGCPCRILSAQAPEAVLRARLEARRRSGGDPSEADERVLDLQLGSQEPLTGDERDHLISIDTSGPLELAGLAARLIAGE
ncbi:AAA family ATPase [Thioflavicoccus mobilis]|nr:bifunctional aminoglycoside phosphotransferase/ATP-binding protein [Thioflavicoccus mobilis]